MPTKVPSSAIELETELILELNPASGTDKYQKIFSAIARVNATGCWKTSYKRFNLWLNEINWSLKRIEIVSRDYGLEDPLCQY